MLRKIPVCKASAHLIFPNQPHQVNISIGIHTSSYLCRKKRLHYNRYIKENKVKVYSGFVQDVLDKTQTDFLQNITPDEMEPDFEKRMMLEAKKRRNIYEYKKARKKEESLTALLEQKMNLKPKHKRKFTHEQMNHIKYLRDENPDIWTHKELSTAFNCSKDEIVAILRSKFKPRKNIQDMQDSRAKETNRRHLLMSGDPNDESGLSLYKKANGAFVDEATTLQSNEKQNQLRNEWFLNYQNSTAHRSSYDDAHLELFNESDEDCYDHFLDEIHSDDHYEELFAWDVPDDIDSQHHNEENTEYDLEDREVSEFKVTTKDKVIFHDEQGKFLFRIP